MLKYYVIAIAVGDVVFFTPFVLSSSFQRDLFGHARAIEYPNYPFIISYIFMGATTSFAIVLLRRKQGVKT